MNKLKLFIFFAVLSMAIMACGSAPEETRLSPYQPGQQAAVTTTDMTGTGKPHFSLSSQSSSPVMAGGGDCEPFAPDPSMAPSHHVVYSGTSIKPCVTFKATNAELIEAYSPAWPDLVLQVSIGNDGTYTLIGDGRVLKELFVEFVPLNGNEKYGIEGKETDAYRGSTGYALSINNHEEFGLPDPGYYQGCNELSCLNFLTVIVYPDNPWASSMELSVFNTHHVTVSGCNASVGIVDQQKATVQLRSFCHELMVTLHQPYARLLIGIKGPVVPAINPTP